MRSWAAIVAVAVLGYFTTSQVAVDIDRFWKEPRDLLVDRVEAVRDSQTEGAETFRDALTEFKAIVGQPDRELQARYNALNDAYERSDAVVIETNVDALIADMNRSIAEADAFIRAMLDRG